MAPTGVAKSATNRPPGFVTLASSRRSDGPSLEAKLTMLPRATTPLTARGFIGSRSPAAKTHSTGASPVPTSARLRAAIRA